MARHSGGSLATKLFAVACGLLYAIALGRLLGPNGYGVVAFTISAATIVATISLLGVNELAVREVASLSVHELWGDLNQFVVWSIRTVAIGSLIGGCTIATASLFSGPYRDALLLGALAVPLLALLQLMRGLIQGSGKILVAQVPNDLVRWILTLALIAFLFLSSWRATPLTIILVLVVSLAASLGVAGGIVLAYLHRLPRVNSPVNGAPSRLLQSLPFLTIALFGIFGTEMGTLLLGWLAGPREAGLYQPIAKLAPLMMLANEAIEAALAPKIVHSWEQGDRATLQRRISRSALASALATGAAVAAIVIASPHILRAFGPEFTRYQRLIVWIGAAQILNAATGAAPLLLAMTGDMRSRIGAQAATMVVQVGLGVALIPSFGAVGAVAALVAAILVWSLLHWWLALRSTGIDTSPLAARWVKEPLNA